MPDDPPPTPTTDWDYRLTPESPHTLTQFLGSEWIDYYGLGRETRPDGHLPLQDSPFESTSPWVRHDQTVPSVVAELRDRGVRRAVLSPTTVRSVSGFGNPRFGMAVARAVNEWQMEEWFDSDDTFLGSIVVTARDANIAAAEVHRLAQHPRMVQVLLAYPPVLLGDRSLHPLYAAASSHGLPVSLMAGAGFAGANGGLLSVGHPVTDEEYRLTWHALAAPHLASLLAQGTFRRFPELHVILSGFGVSWLAPFLWSATGHLAGDPGEDVAALLRTRCSYVAGSAEADGHEEDVWRLLEESDLLPAILPGSGLSGGGIPSLTDRVGSPAHVAALDARSEQILTMRTRGLT